MKKIYSLLLAAIMGCFFLTSCSDDDSLNTTNATVSMGETVCRVKENRGIFYAPIVVEGEQNGDIFVTVDVASTNDQCKEDVHFIVTSKNIRIPADKKSANVEIKAIDDRVINDDRSFTVKIVDVKGATVNQQLAATEVIMLDNDDIPYDRMDGEWTVTATDHIDDATTPTVTWKTRLTTVVDEDAEGYGSLITMSPWRMYDGDTHEDELIIQHSLTFSYNEASQTATLNLRLGESMVEGLIMGGSNDNGYDLTDCLMRSGTTANRGHTINGNVVGTVNSTFTEIRFNLPLIGVLFDANGLAFSYWFYYSDIVLTRNN